MKSKIESIFDSYCKKVLKNKAYDIQRKKSKLSKKEISLESLNHCELSEVTMIPVYDAECVNYRVLDEYIMVENDCLNYILNKLLDDELEIIMLYYFCHMTDSEIADHICCTRKKVNRLRLGILNKMNQYANRYLDEI